MARQKRIWYPGATYHVMSRGNRRSAIYKEHSDYVHFLEIMRMVKEKYPFTVHSICLMTNHFHMSIETGDTELWKLMQKILSVTQKSSTISMVTMDICLKADIQHL